MAKPYNLGDNVVIPAVVKRCNPSRQLVILAFQDGSETGPMTWDLLEMLEEDAQRMAPREHDTVQQDAPPNAE